MLIAFSGFIIRQTTVAFKKSPLGVSVATIVLVSHGRDLCLHVNFRKALLYSIFCMLLHWIYVEGECLSHALFLFIGG